MQDIGGISYTVDANISGLLKFDKQIDVTERNAVQSFGAIDKAAEQAGQQMVVLSKSAEKAADNITSAGSQAAQSISKIQEPANQVSGYLAGLTYSTVQLFQSTAKSADQAAVSVKKVGSEAKTAAASTASMSAVPVSLNKITQATDQASDKMRNMRAVAGNLGFQLQDIAVQAQAGTSAFTILGQQGSQIASAFGPGGAVLGAIIAISAAIGGVLVKSLSEATAKAGELPAALEEKLTKIKERLKETDEASKAAFSSVEIAKANAEYERLGSLIEGLRKKQESYKKQIQEAASPEIRKNYERLYSDVSDQIEVATKSQRIQALYVEKVTKATLESREGWEGVKEETEKTTSEAERLEKQLVLAVTKLEEGDLAARRMAAAMILNLKAGEQLPANIDALIKKEFELEQQQKRTAQAKQQWAREAAELQKEIADDERAAAQEAFEEEQRRRSAFQGVQKSVMQELESPADAARRELSERLRVIQEYYQLENTEKAKQTAEGIAAEQAYQKRLTEIKKAEEEKRLGFNNVTLSATADLFGNLAQMAEQGGKDSFNSWKLFASAQAAVNAALAITNALATVPPPLNFAVAGTVAAMTAAQIAKISSMNYGGGRLYGGPVQAGTMYPVTENGKPELLVQGNRQYLLPGAGGRVISNKDMQAGGGGVTIYLNPSTTINAIDTQSAAQFIAQNAEAISVAVDKQMQKYGRSNRR